MPDLPDKANFLVRELLKGNRRALAQAITVIESGNEQSAYIIKEIFPHSGNAHIIGVTGSPGVGKSTLIDKIISAMRSAGHNVAVLTIDPTSPFTGGAILGDRLRMQQHTLDPNVFIRSMANRGYEGGIAAATYDAIRLLEAAGFHTVIIETVGAGQSEISIAKTADTVVLLLMPGSGDDIQALKSGIMEIGDIFVINKSDLPAAQQTASDILASIQLSFQPDSKWLPPVILASAKTNEGSQEIWQAILKHKQYLQSSGLLPTRKSNRVLNELQTILTIEARKRFFNSLHQTQIINKLVDNILAGKIDPYTAANELMPEIL